MFMFKIKEKTSFENLENGREKKHIRRLLMVQMIK